MVDEALVRFRFEWWRRLAPAHRRAFVALLCMAIAGGALVARSGTDLSRAIALALIMTVFLMGARWLYRWAAQGRDPQRVVRDLIMPVQPEQGRRLMRALTMVARADRESDAIGMELGRSYVHRMLERISGEQIERRAQRRASFWSWLAVVMASGALLVSMIDPTRILEGLNVQLAVHGVAPVRTTWLDLDSCTAYPPSYLRQGDHPLWFDMLSSEPRGTVVVVRGTPRHPGRRLILTDGRVEVPFTSDGRGGMTARWTLLDSVRLRVAARFGEVRIEQSDELTLDAFRDQPPRIELQGAPRNIDLAKTPSVDLEYRVTDDYGIRQIDLILETAGRQERRSLASLDGETRSEPGAYVLQARDTFLRDTFLPVTVTIAARDDDVVDGPKWARSAALTLVPPAVGQPQALRLAALEHARSKLLDWLNFELTESRAPPEKRRKWSQAALGALLDVKIVDPPGLAMPRGLVSFMLAQRAKVLASFQGAPPHIGTLESVTLAVDSAMSELAQWDAHFVARHLAEVSDEIARVADLASTSEHRNREAGQVDAALVTLQKGGAQLGRLGSLGSDLAHIVQAAGGRIHRARADGDYPAVKLAASFLSARLRRPSRSFVGGTAGVEAAFATHDSELGEPTTESMARFNRLATEIDRIISEHATEIETVQRALDDAQRSVDLSQFAEEARRRARELRAIADRLPVLGSEPGTAVAAAALAREHTLSTADAMERLALAPALESARGAEAALQEAEARSSEPSKLDVPIDIELLRSTGADVRGHRQWLERVVKGVSDVASQRASDGLRGSADREADLGRRTQDISNREQAPDSVLPEVVRQDLGRASRLMQQAADHLRSGLGRRGLDLQLKAQRLLEQSEPGQTQGQDLQPDDGGTRQAAGESEDLREHSPVVPTSDPKAREEFRRRVQEGFNTELPEGLSPVVRRYAEGLLR